MNSLTPINYLYIPHVNKNITAEYIAYVFAKYNIADISKVAFEHRDTETKRAHIQIKYWQDTGAAFSFIDSLRNKRKETRFVYADEYWWVVEINKYPHKLHTDNTARTITIFKEIVINHDLQAKFYGYKNIEEMDDANDINDYLHEINDDRAKWISEQYIYDTLHM